MSVATIPVRELSGGQLQELMDTLLYAALKPVVESTDLFTPQLTYILSLLVVNRKRKPCACDPDRAMYYLVSALSAPRDQRMQYITALRLERNFVYGFLRNLLRVYHKPFMACYTGMCKSSNDEAAMSAYRTKADSFVSAAKATSRSSFYHMLQNVSYMLPEFVHVFNSAVQNFTALCAQLARAYVKKNPQHQYDVNDVIQNFVRATITAMNKYDCNRGAHASYVKWWIYHAQTCGASDHEYGLAYIIPQSQKKKLATSSDASDSNFSVSLDAPTGEDDSDGSGLHERVGSESQDLEGEINLVRHVRRIAEIAKMVDPYGISRTQFDMDEVFFPFELEIMKQHMAEQNL